jgi:hypothetical protein
MNQDGLTTQEGERGFRLLDGYARSTHDFFSLGVFPVYWGDYRFGGWRADVVWVYVSSVAAFFFGTDLSRSVSALNQAYKSVVGSSAVWPACFVVYAGYV